MEMELSFVMGRIYRYRHILTILFQEKKMAVGLKLFYPAPDKLLTKSKPVLRAEPSLYSINGLFEFKGSKRFER